MTSAHKKTQSYQILLAEDSAADAEVVRLALHDEKIDHVLHVARDGEEAISYIRQADESSHAAFDLLILDMHLPKFSGDEILRFLRSTELHAQIPVVVMSSANTLQDQKSAQRHAVLTYFHKPGRLEDFIELGRIISRILTGKGGLKPA